MSKFWDKNRQKSKWAALLLLLRWRKGVVPLILLVLLILFMFSAPSNLLASLVRGLAGKPFGGGRAAATITWLASRMGLDGFGDGKHSYADLLAAFRQAKDGNGNGGINVFLRGDAGGGVNQDSLSMVRNTEDGDANLASKIKGGNGIHGILSQEEAKAAGKGLELDPGDLAGQRSGLVQSAYGEGTRLPGGLNVKGDQFESITQGAGAFAPSWFFSASGHAANPNMVRSTLGNTTSVPIAGQGSTATRRPLGWSSPTNLSQTAGGASRNYGKSGGLALGQLVQARNAGVMSSGNICSAANGCPGEFASSNMGQIYDGDNINSSITGDNNTTPNIVSGPADIDGTANPTIPDPNTDISNTGDVTGGVANIGAETACQNEIAANQQTGDTYRAQLEADNQTLGGYIQALGNGMCNYSCPSSCGQCQNQVNLIQNFCNTTITQDYNNIYKPLPTPDCSAAACTSDPSMCPPGSVQTGGSVQDTNQQNSLCDGQQWNNTGCGNGWLGNWNPDCWGSDLGF